MYYDEAAERLIIQGFSKKTESSEAEQKHTNETAVEAVILTLQKELEAKDRQIDELTSALKSAQLLHSQEQHLHAATLKHLPAARKDAEDEWQQMSDTLEKMRLEAQFRADAAIEAEEQRAAAERRAETAEDIAELNAQEAARAKAEAEDLRAKLEQIATARGFKRRKLLKELRRRETDEQV